MMSVDDVRILFASEVTNLWRYTNVFIIIIVIIIVYLFIHHTTSRNRNTVPQEKYNLFE